MDGGTGHDAGVHRGVRRQEREALDGVCCSPVTQGSLRGEVAGVRESGGMVSTDS